MAENEEYEYINGDDVIESDGYRRRKPPVPVYHRPYPIDFDDALAIAHEVKGVRKAVENIDISGGSVASNVDVTSDGKTIVTVDSINEIQSILQDINQSIKDIGTGDISEIYELIEKLQNDISEVHEVLTIDGEEIDDIKSRLGNDESNIGEILSIINTLDDLVQSLTESVQSMSSDIGLVSGEVNELNSSVSSIVSQVDELIEKYNIDLEEIKSKLAEIEEEILTITGGVGVYAYIVDISNLHFICTETNKYKSSNVAYLLSEVSGKEYHTFEIPLTDYVDLDKGHADVIGIVSNKLDVLSSEEYPYFIEGIRYDGRYDDKLYIDAQIGTEFILNFYGAILYLA